MARLQRSWYLIAGFGAVWLLGGLWATAQSTYTARVFVDVGYIVLPLAGLAASGARAILHRGLRRAAWLVFALAFLAWCLGGMHWAYQELVLRQPPPFPSLSDLGFVAYPLLAAAGLYLLSSQWAPRPRVHDVLDAVFIALVVVYALYTVAMREALQALPHDFILVALAYPTADVVVLTLTIFTLSRSQPGKRLQPALIGGGLALLAIVDSAWIYLTATGRYTSGTPFDLLWHASFILVILGIVVARRTATEVEGDTVPLARHAVPLALTLLAALLVMYNTLRTGLDPFQGGIAASLLVVAGTRQTVAMLHNERLRATVAASAQELAEANRQLQEQSRLRTQFINATAHELKNPLTPLRIQAKLLASANPQKREQSVAVMGRAIDRLARLVDDLLSLARLESRTLHIRMQQVDAARLVREAVHLHVPSALERGIQVDVTTPDTLPCTTDPERLHQVLDNFITNAVKYSPAGAVVRVEARLEGSQLRIEVTDLGPGFTEEQQRQLFQPFSQVHGDGVQQKGTGLGLHIARLLAELLGGEVGCQSRGPGQGTTFWVRLPLAPA